MVDGLPGKSRFAFPNLEEKEMLLEGWGSTAGAVLDKIGVGIDTPDLLSTLCILEAEV